MRRRTLTPLSDELRAPDPFPPAPPRRRVRLPRLPKRQPPSTRLGVLLAGLRRFATGLLVIGGVTVGIALLVAHLSNVHRGRAITVGLIVVGAFMVIGALLSSTPMSRPTYGSWEQREQTRAWARVWLALGVSLVGIGLLVDSRHSLF